MGDLKLVLFDMDGVLVDTTVLLKKSYVDLAKYLSARCPTERALREAICLSPNMAVRHLFKDRPYEALRIFNQYWKRNIKQASAFSGIAELLDELVAHKLLIGTVTSRNNSDTLTLLGTTGLSKYMCTVITWGHYRLAKPSPACLLVALSETGIAPNNAAYVGDQAIDICAAKNVGVLAIGAVWSPDARRQELQDAGADVIVEKPREIAKLLEGISQTAP